MALELERVKREVKVETTSPPIRTWDGPICTPIPEEQERNHNTFTNVPTSPLAANCNIPYSVMAGKTHSFTLQMTNEQVKDIMSKIPAGKPVAVSNFSMNIRRGGHTEARATTVNGDVLTFNNFHLDLDFPEVDTEIELGDTVAAIWSPEFIARSHGPIRGPMRGSGGRDSGEREPRIIQGDAVLWNPENDKALKELQNKLFPSIEKMMDVNRILKDQNEKWISFRKITGHWDTTIESAIKGDKKAIEKMTKLSNSSVCILGTAWKGSHWGDMGNSGCHTCSFLGVSALRKFTSSLLSKNGSHNYYPTKMEAYEEYKIMFEYHWNTCHANSH